MEKSERVYSPNANHEIDDERNNDIETILNSVGNIDRNFSNSRRAEHLLAALTRENKVLHERDYLEICKYFDKRTRTLQRNLQTVTLNEALTPNELQDLGTVLALIDTLDRSRFAAGQARHNEGDRL